LDETNSSCTASELPYALPSFVHSDRHWNASQFVSADSPSPSVSKIPAPPLPIQSACSDMQKPFGALADVMDRAARAAADAGADAKELGTWSNSRRFRTVEDDYIAVGKLLAPGLDATSSVPVWLDNVPDGSQKAAATDLGASYDKSLRMIQQYASAAVVYERTAYEKRMRLQPGVGVDSHEVIVSLGTAGHAMNADDARRPLRERRSRCRCVANAKVPRISVAESVRKRSRR
jgi:hypothetical protein